MRFIHTADWQIGKPFARIIDQRKRALVQQARFDCIDRIAKLARERDARFVLVAGDLFDSPRADRSTVSAACAAIGRIGVPVIVIPGNHDHAGPGSIWEQEYYLREQRQLAPNLVVLTEPGPYRTESALILACPLRARSGWADPTEWLRVEDAWMSGAEPGAPQLSLDHTEAHPGCGDRVPRIVLAHGSIQSFTGRCDDEDELERGSEGTIDLSRLPHHLIDYVALGDWHGTKQVGPKAWYAGTPEPDRFAKAGDYSPGNVLVVDVEPGGQPLVSSAPTGRLRWADMSLDVSGIAGVKRGTGQIVDAVGRVADQALLSLTLTGTVSIEAAGELQRFIESQEARLLRLKLANRTVIEPTESELLSLLAGSTHPLVSSVAERLLDMAAGDDDGAEIARVALRELYISVGSPAPGCSGTSAGMVSGAGPGGKSGVSV